MPPENPGKPPAGKIPIPHLNPEEISELAGIISAWSVEVGVPNMRPSCEILQKRLQETKIQIDRIWEDLNQQIPQEHAILLILALAPNQPTLRNVFLRQALSNLVRAPVGKAIPTLLHFSPEEIKANLAPLLYLDGANSRRAVYLMARLSLSLNADSIPLFLSSHDWDDNSLKNLAILADAEKPSEFDRILTDHEKDNPSAQFTELSKKILDFFKERDSLTPISPDPGDGQSQAAGVAKIPARANDKPREKPATELPDDSIIPSRPQAAQPAFSKPQHHVPPNDDIAWESQDIPGDNYQAEPASDSPFGVSRNTFWGLIGLGAVALFMLFFLFGTPDPEKLPSPAKRVEAPSFWIDAVSRKQITQNFLMADNDFQMGELFLVRGKYSNALSLFKDALSREPKHAAAQFRVGYCLVQLQDYLEAGKALRKTLEIQGDFPNANLYLARICLVQKEWEKALEYFNKEYAIKSDASIGLEYAQWLHKLGKFPEAIKILSDLEKRDPGNLSISSILAEVKLDAGGLKK